MPHFMSPLRLILLSVISGSLIAACSSTEPFGPSVDVSVDVRQAVALPSTLRIQVGSSATLLHVDATSATARTTLHVVGYGEKAVLVTLLGAQSDTLASVAYSQSFQTGYQYGIGAVVSRVRPIGVCIGTGTATPLRNSASDTLFVVYEALPKGAVC
jgi:hypothetical protein